MPRFRSTRLDPAVPSDRGPVGLTLDVDALRRRDGLNIEDDLYRQERALRGVGPGDLAGLAARLEALETAMRRGRPIASYAGDTPGAVAPMTTSTSDGIAALGNVGASLITFTFDQPAPNTFYRLAYSQTAGGANGVQHQIQTPTLTGFTLICLASTGGTSNPQTTVWSFSFTVLCPES